MKIDKSPTWEPRRFIDKVGLQFPSHYFEGENYRCFAVGSITILRWGDWSQLLIHQEAMLPEETMDQAIFRALVQLAYCGVFRIELGVYLHFLAQSVSEGTFPFQFVFAHLMSFFSLNEIEVAFDFPGVEYLATMKEDFRQVWNTTFYTKDYHKKRWGEDSIHAHKAKGTQKSFFKIYRKDLQLGSKSSPITRMEFSFSGKYRKALNSSILNLTQDEAISHLLPAIKTTMHRLTSPENLVFNPSLLLYKGSPLAQFLRDIQWFPEDSQFFGGAY